MTDIRFHVVSLVAVFLALAVGVVLGSGPMRAAFVGELAGEVDALEAQVLQGQADLELERAQAREGEQFIDESTQVLIGGTLDGAVIALVGVMGADPAHVEAQREAIVAAGGSVAAIVTIGEAWTDPNQSVFRAALATQFVTHVVNVEEGTSSTIVLSHALAQALMPDLAAIGEASDDPDAGPGLPGTQTATDRSAVLVDLLRQADMLTGFVSGSVDGVVIVSGVGSDDDEARARDAAVFAHVAEVMQGYGAAVVVASGPDAPGDVPEAVTGSATARERVSTVSFGTSIYGRYSVVLALAEQYGGGVGHYGPGEGRDFVPMAGRSIAP